MSSKKRKQDGTDALALRKRLKTSEASDPLPSKAQLPVHPPLGHVLHASDSNAASRRPQEILAKVRRLATGVKQRPEVARCDCQCTV
jgi:hypothetical protein